MRRAGPCAADVAKKQQWQFIGLGGAHSADALGEAGDLPGRRPAMEDALLSGPRHDRLGFLQGGLGGLLVT